MAFIPRKCILLMFCFISRFNFIFRSELYLATLSACPPTVLVSLHARAQTLFAHSVQWQWWCNKTYKICYLRLWHTIASNRSKNESTSIEITRHPMRYYHPCIWRMCNICANRTLHCQSFYIVTVLSLPLFMWIHITHRMLWLIIISCYIYIYGND